MSQSPMPPPKRQVLTMLGLAVGHFLIGLAFAWMWMRTGPPKKELGPLSDHWTGWPLIVWLFPVRNIANWFEENADEWFFHLRGLIVAGVAAVLWAAVLYYLFQLVRSRRIAT